MDADRWQRVEQLCHAALERSIREQPAFLDEACAGDEAMRREVESLLAHQAQGEHFLEAPALAVAAEALARDESYRSAQAARLIGRVLSDYRVVEKLGGGGMGEVYRAVRADGTYEKQVAIKLVQSGLGTEFFLARFKNERQILASLDHPNIARLIDGGSTEEGLPYVVMEYIEGRPIDEYCDQNGLGIPGRLELFRTVCSAVQYAHKNLVVHRDLKPWNILVTKDGVPKLLDFGIAKILHTQEPQELNTVTLLPLMTPDYASPEQIRGDAITTASDVYSLGVILYVLLTGRHPHRTKGTAPHELIRAICEAEPEKPSTAAEEFRLSDAKSTNSSTAVESPPVEVKKRRRALAGDLDNIVLKALRKEPERRYATVEQFSEDIRHYVMGLPVIAHRDSPRYRARKFIVRHRLGVAAAVLLVLSLVGGMITTLWQARVAKYERARAESRFNDVRALANSLLFEVHDSIENLPGATAARKVIVQKSLEYLDRLSRQATGDVSLQRELATAYEKVGQVQGNGFGPNLGDPAGALDSFGKALAIRQAVVGGRASASNVDDQAALAGAYRRIGQVQWFSLGDTGKGLEDLQIAVTIAEAATRNGAGKLSVLKELAADYKYLGDVQAGIGVRGSVGRLREALENHRRALAIFKQVADATPSDFAGKGELAMADIALGDDLVKAGDRVEALSCYQRARELLEPLVETTTNALFRRSLAVCYTRTGDALLMNGRPTGALRYYREEFRLFEPLAAADPKDIDVQSYLITSRGDIGHALVEAGRIKEGLSVLLRALRGQAALAKTANDSHSRSLVASTEILVGEAFERAGETSSARQSYSRALDIYSAILAADTKDIEDMVNEASTRNHLGRAYVREGNVKQALEEYRKAMSMSLSLGASSFENIEVLYALADAYAGLGDVSALLARRTRNPKEQSKGWSKAHDWYQKSLIIWQKIPDPANISPNFFEVTDLREVTRRANLAARKSLRTQ